ncbi:MAG TPA: hypothetical protein VG937_13560 [Polyangiaceae bacterium]|nr:hypothetical protein [Polyangiaceae bacterium]
MPELGRTARLAFVIAFLSLQVALILTAELRPDRIFSFRMFNESSKLSFELFREVRGRRGPRRVPVRDGTWQARTPAGSLAEFHWTDRVRFFSLTRPSVLTHTPYGLDAQLFRLQKALEDVAAHIPEDTETRALIAVADTQKNGRPAGRVTLRAARP